MNPFHSYPAQVEISMNAAVQMEISIPYSIIVDPLALAQICRQPPFQSFQGQDPLR